ncbi:hypothetical protein VP01_3489g3 [Puccinia sorghi]|uniref:Uncharacterized protein n=1 Tax=Puccinia sorghi TaxID=27349 RepID=A0A0L6UVZ0_9BASI|nr:hypothetical protein VP01_3489g3 [Puccinia sorghi]
MGIEPCCRGVTWGLPQRGNTKTGATKSALANEILLEMADAGINHWDKKDIESGTTNLPGELISTLAKICKYWDGLHPIMAIRTCTNPPVTMESTNIAIPDLFGTQTPTNTEANTTVSVGN